MKKSITSVLRLLFFVGIVLLASSKLQAFLYPYETIVAKWLRPIEITESESNVKGVDCIYVINLDKRPDKWRRMKALFDEKSIKVNRVSGIYGRKIPQEIRGNLQGPYYPSHDFAPGAIGCLLSHVSCMKDAYERGFDTIWIFEDDAEFIEDYHQIPELLERLTQIDPDWDVFYTDTDWRHPEGGYTKNTGINPRPDQTIFPLEYYCHRKSVDYNIMKVGQRYGMHSYIVSRKGMEKILYYYTHSYIWTAIDIDLHYIEGIRQYSPKKDIIVNWRQTPYNDTGGDTSTDLSDRGVSCFENTPKQ